MRAVALSFAAAVLTAGSSYAQDEGVRLTVRVTGADANVGQVAATLFDSQDVYMVTPTMEVTVPVDSAGEAQAVFDGLAAGDHAVSVVYDRDSDGKLDTGLFGIPREKIGFSNDARARFGPATWDDARFTVGAEGAEITINLTRAKRD